MIITGISAGSARAWDEPLCALDETMTRPYPLPREILVGDGAMCSLDSPTLPFHVPEDGAIDDATARRAMRQARELAARGERSQALLHLRVVEGAFPRLADRVALMRGELLLGEGRPGEARRAYETALESPESTVQALARVGRVRALIHEGHRSAATELASLMRRYPELAEALKLRFELGRSHEVRGQAAGAVRIYRDIDLMHPGSPVATQARGRLAALADGGERVPELTLLQQVDRAERLAQQGPMHMARAEVERLLGQRLTGDLRQRTALAAARVARIEGRFADERRYTNAARTGGPLETVDEQELRQRAVAAGAAANARDQEAARRLVQQLKGNRPWARVPHQQLRNIIGIAARAGLNETVNEALAVLAKARGVHPQVQFDAAILAAGIGDDEHVAKLFEGLVRHPRFGLEAQYHHARALERLGRWVDAERELLEVERRDRSALGYYRLWAEQRLWAVREAMVCDCGPEEMARRQAARRSLREAAAEAEGPLVLASLEALVDPAAPSGRPAAEGKVAPGEVPPLGRRDSLDMAALRMRLGPVAEAHGAHYPWLPRAVDLLRLGEARAASDELHEAFLAWRDAAGRGIRRVGLESVNRGAERPRERVDWRTKRERLRLGARDRQVIAEVASALGDEGTAAGLLGVARVNSLPRAHEATVRAVAARHGLDPNLLLAVMRVESVYQSRIISYAGAVGLMQIMPRTGRLIADALDRDDFTTADLLDPETNLEFAAWYLASLIDRWDGHLPLAIASYNGGPHNVRRWLAEHGEGMSLDAFLERIPFSQTHRYVRRVLTYYAAYRAQQGLPMQRLSVELPPPGHDPVGF